MPAVPGFESPHFAAERPTWVRWRIVLLLMSFAFMNHFNRTCMAVADTSIKREFRLSDTQMGTIYSAFLLAYVLCMTPGGWFADRRGARLALTVVGLGTALFVALTGVGGYGLLAAGLALPSLVVIRFLMGLFTAPLFPAAGRALSQWMPFSQQAWANGLVIGSTTAGVGLAHVLFGKLIDDLGWRIAFVVTGTCTGLLACLWRWYAKDRPGDHAAVNRAELALIAEGTTLPADQPAPGKSPDSQADDGGWLPLLRNKSLMLLTLNYAAVGYFEYMLFYWMEHYFKEVRHLPVLESRRYATIVPFAMLFTMPLGGWLSDRLVRQYGRRAGRASVAIAGFLSSAVLLYVATQAVDRFWMVTWFFLAHGAIGLCEAPIWVTGLELGGRRCGTSAAMVNTGGNLGGLIAPQVTPLIGGWLGWQSGLNVGSLICLAAIALWIWIDPSGERDLPGNR